MDCIVIHHDKKGYATLITVIFTTIISLTIIAGFSFFTLQEVNTNRAFIKSIESHYVSESGIEDGVWRVVTAKQIGASETLDVGNGMTTITVTSSANQRIVRSEGVRDNLQRNLQTTIDINTKGVNFVYGVQVGDGGVAMDTQSTITGSVYSNGDIIGDNNAKITGDAIVAGGNTSVNPDVQWTAQNTDFLFATTTASEDIAQSFTAGSTGALTKVSVYLAKVGSPGSNLTLRITTDSNGRPNTSDITNQAITPGMVGASASWIDIPLATSPNVTQGTKYWIVLDYNSHSTANYWNWRKDNTDAYTNNTGKYSDDWDANNPTWKDVKGDLAFRVWVGGSNKRIEAVTIGNATSGSGRANLFVNATIHGTSCPNAYCIIDNPARQDMPIPQSTIEDWKNEADDGDPINGNYEVTDDVSLGPKKITGDLLITATKKTLTVTGTVYVKGNISLDNGSKVKCASSFALNSCIIMSDGWIHIKNNGGFSGSGQAGSYVMFLSTSSCDGVNVIPPCDSAHHNAAIDIHNNATGTIFYAETGLLNIHNGVKITEATAYKLHVDQNAEVIYEQGLADAHFSSGPTGGYNVKEWKEVQ